LEIEVKVRVASRPVLRKKMLALGAKKQCPRSLERNLVFDSPAGELRERGILLRLRGVGGRGILTMKTAVQGDPAYKVRAETETAVADFAAAEAILRGIGLRPVFVYEKYREEFSLGRVQLMLDETPIGVFLEIEGEPTRIDATAMRLGYSRSDYLSASYLQLFLSSGGEGDMVFAR
jgi:adenylate cyclase class 2